MASDIVCPICLDPLTNSVDEYLKPMAVVVTGCGHLFHEPCLLQAFRRKGDKPPPAADPAAPAGAAGGNAAGAVGGAAADPGFMGMRDYEDSDEEGDGDSDDDDSEAEDGACPACPICKTLPDVCEIGGCEGHFGEDRYSESYTKTFFSNASDYVDVEIPVDATSKRHLQLASEMKKYASNLEILLTRGEKTVLDRALERGLANPDDNMEDEYLFGGHGQGEAGEAVEADDGQDEAAARAEDRQTLMKARRTEKKLAESAEGIKAVVARAAADHSTLLMQARVSSISTSLDSLSSKLSLLPICLRQSRLLRKKREEQRTLQVENERLQAAATNGDDRRVLKARIAELERDVLAANTQKRVDKAVADELFAEERREKDKAVALAKRLADEKRDLKHEMDQQLKHCKDQAKQDLDDLRVEMLTERKERKDRKLQEAKRELLREQTDKRKKAIELAEMRLQVRTLMKQIDRLKNKDSARQSLERTSSSSDSVVFVGEGPQKRSIDSSSDEDDEEPAPKRRPLQSLARQ